MFDLFVVVEKAATITAVVSPLVVKETTTTTSNSTGSQSRSRCGAGGDCGESRGDCRGSFDYCEGCERDAGTGVNECNVSPPERYTKADLLVVECLL